MAIYIDELRRNRMFLTFKTENKERVTVNEEEGVWDPKCNGYPHNVKRFWAPIFTKRSPNMVVSAIIVDDD